MSPGSFSHLDADGTARMVDTGHKPMQRRTAVAQGFIQMAPATIIALRAHALPKGDVLTVARVAAIQAAKRTDSLIPLCHSLPLDAVDVDFNVQPEGVAIQATAITTARTGVEMEALTAVTIAGLTIYDMCKAIDKSMTLRNIHLVSKTKQ